MIHPLSVVTDGLLTLQGINTGAIATDGLMSPDAVSLDDGSSRWAGEWLPLPVPKHLEPAKKPSRKVKVHGKGPKPRAIALPKAIPRCRASAALVVHYGPISEITCRVDMTKVHEEETILAAIAAML